jgi:hypothetical protein
MIVLVIALPLEIRSVGWWAISEGGDIGDTYWRKQPCLALLRSLICFVARLKIKV